MSDIHGFFLEFENALSIIEEDLDKEDVKLVLLGDYIHGGKGGRQVINRIIEMQRKYGSDKVVALKGNHDDWVLKGFSSLDHMITPLSFSIREEDVKYLAWIESLPLWHVEGKTIFVHGGINEAAGENWQKETGKGTCLMKYPAVIGKAKGISEKIVAGHVWTSEISGNPNFHGIYYDGQSHYYIDGQTYKSGKIPVLMVDTLNDEYFSISEQGCYRVNKFGG